jgi:hypothetical protein
MNIYHMHHIIPQHSGGTNNPDNLIKLTIAEHAAAHKKLWEEYGNEYDRIAWLGLEKTINSAEINLLKQIEGGKQSFRNNPNRNTGGAAALWKMHGMRKHLIQKRKEQHLNGISPMRGKKQLRVSCIFCKKETAINTLISNHKKCK